MMNERIRNIRKELLSDNWYTLYKYTYEYLNNDNQWKEQTREAYDRGNGAAILLYNKISKKVILTKQFRLPTFINGNPTGMMIEACAGLLDEIDPLECIKRETEEETGYKVNQVEKVLECYMSPGSVTERLHLYIAEYNESMKISQGGGLEEEQENIEVIELPLTEALHMIKTHDIKDAKTILLLQYAIINNIL